MSLPDTPPTHYEKKVNYEYKNYGGDKIKNYHVKIDGKYLSKQPLTILSKPKEAIVGQKIINYNFNMGAYDWGYIGDPRALGVGYFGILLLNPTDGKKEWLVVTLSSAATHFCLLDSKWIRSFNTSVDTFRPAQEPWFIQGKGVQIQKDDFSAFINECVISDLDLKPEVCRITLEKNGHTHLLEIFNSDPRLCPWPGTQYKAGKENRYVAPKAFKEGTDQIGNYVIFMEEKGEIFVSN